MNDENRNEFYNNLGYTNNEENKDNLETLKNTNNNSNEQIEFLDIKEENYSKENLQNDIFLNNNFTDVSSIDNKMNENQQENNIKLNEVSNKKINPKKILLIIALLLIVVVIAIIINNSFNKKNVSIEDELTNATSYFIENDEGMFAIFNDDGKKLSDFEFVLGDQLGFINGSALVHDKEYVYLAKDNTYGIVSDKGKMLVDYGKYTFIEREGAFYEATDEEYNKYLLDSKGKVLLQLNEIDVISYIEVYSFIILSTEDEYVFMDYKGDKFLTINKVKGSEPLETSRAENKNVHLLSIYYNNQNYYIDLNTGKEIYSLVGSCYNIYDINNNAEFILKECEGSNYKYIKNKKNIYDVNDDSCSGVVFRYGKLICTGSSSERIISESGQVYSFDQIDDQNYLKNNFPDGIDLYTSKDVINIYCAEDAYSPSPRYDIYLLKSRYIDECEAKFGRYMYYKKDGTLLIDKPLQKANDFDENGFAIVSEDGENYYLIDTNGKQVTKEYKNIRHSNWVPTDLYYIVDDGNQEYLLNKELKVLISNKNVTQELLGSKRLVALASNDKEYVVYNTKLEKEIVTLNSKPEFKLDYFITRENDKTTYYSYNTGKIIYQET